MLSTSQRLRTIRSIYGHREGRRGRGEVAYLVYVVFLVAISTGLPLGRGVLLMLTGPGVLAGLEAPGGSAVVTLVLGALTCTAVWLGAFYGPVLPEPAMAKLLGGTDMRRRRGLLRTFILRAVVVIGAAALAAGVLGAVLVRHAQVPIHAALAFTGIAGVFGLLLAVTWLTGQALSTTQARLTGAGLALLVALGAAAPAVTMALPWSWAASAWPVAPTFGLLEAILLAALAACAALAVGPLLDALRMDQLLEDGEKWRSAGTSALYGDVSLALDGLRARPAIGRRWRAVASEHEWLRLFRSDMVGGLRTPVRLLVGSVVLGGAMALVAFSGVWRPAWLIGMVGGIAAFGALGVVSDGFRHAAQAAGGPPLYGYSHSKLFVLHSLLPVLVVLVAAGAGGLVATQVAAAPFNWVVLLFAPVALALRAFHSAKGPLPPALLTPVPTPMGDLSAANVLAWEADSLIYTAAASAFLTAQYAAGNYIIAIIAAAAMVAAALGSLNHRLTKL